MFDYFVDYEDCMEEMVAIMILFASLFVSGSFLLLWNLIKAEKNKNVIDSIDEIRSILRLY